MKKITEKPRDCPNSEQLHNKHCLCFLEYFLPFLTHTHICLNVSLKTKTYPPNLGGTNRTTCINDFFFLKFGSPIKITPSQSPNRTSEILTTGSLFCVHYVWQTWLPATDCLRDLVSIAAGSCARGLGFKPHPAHTRDLNIGILVASLPSSTSRC